MNLIAVLGQTTVGESVPLDQILWSFFLLGVVVSTITTAIQALPWRIRRERRWGPLRLVRDRTASRDPLIQVHNLFGRLLYVISWSDAKDSCVELHRWRRLSQHGNSRDWWRAELIGTRPVSVTRKDNGETFELAPGDWTRLYRFGPNHRRPRRGRREFVEWVNSTKLDRMVGETWVTHWAPGEDGRKPRKVWVASFNDSVMVTDAETKQRLWQFQKNQIDHMHIELTTFPKGYPQKGRHQRHRYAVAALTSETVDPEAASPEHRYEFVDPRAWGMLAPFITTFNAVRWGWLTTWRSMSDLPSWVVEQRVVGKGGVGEWRGREVMVVRGENGKVNVHDYATGEVLARHNPYTSGEFRLSAGLGYPPTVVQVGTDEAAAVGPMFEEEGNGMLQPEDWVPLAIIGQFQFGYSGYTLRVGTPEEVEDVRVAYEVLSWAEKEKRGGNPSLSALKKVGVDPDQARLMYELVDATNGLAGPLWEYDALKEAFDTTRMLLA